MAGRFSLQGALAEMVRLAGPDRTAAVLLKLLRSRSALARHFLDRLLRGKTAPTERFLSRLLDVACLDPAPAAPLTEVLGRSLDPGIAIYGLFTAEIGIGQSARRSARALATTEVRTSRHNITVPLFENRIAFDADADLNPRLDTALVHLNPDTLLDRMPYLPLGALLAPRRIGYWHWELPVFPARWQEACNRVDEVWAPSAFVADAVRQAADLPVRIVPHAVPSDALPREQAREVFGLPASAFMALNIFDFNSFPSRKNPVGTIRAFLDAFPNTSASDHLLVMKSHGRGRRGQAFDEMLRLAASDPRIVLIDEAFSEERMRLLQAACDVYISLHRSEGFGLNLLECMALGKLAIGTAFSGNMTFMTAANSVLVPYREQRVGPGEYLYGEGQWWAEPDHDVAVEALRWAAAGGSEVSARTAAGCADALRDHSFEAIGRLSAAAWRGETPPR